jgi:hypothetical protein
VQWGAVEVRLTADQLCHPFHGNIPLPHRTPHSPCPCPSIFFLVQLRPTSFCSIRHCYLATMTITLFSIMLLPPATCPLLYWNQCGIHSLSIDGTAPVLRQARPLSFFKKKSKGENAGHVLLWISRHDACPPGTSMSRSNMGSD